MAQKRIGQLDAATTPLVGDELLELEKGGSVKVSIAVLLQDAIFPAGFTADFAGTSAPDGWLECDGAVISQTTYARLFAAIGTTWDTGGEGAGNFRLPDLRGAYRRGAGSHGSETMANGNPFAGPAVGAFEDDQVQGHKHSIGAGGSHAHYMGVFDLAGAPPVGAYQGKWGNRVLDSTGAASHSHPDSEFNAALSNDGTNGKPSSGDESGSFAAGMLVCVKT